MQNILRWCRPVGAGFAAVAALAGLCGGGAAVRAAQEPTAPQDAKPVIPTVETVLFNGKDLSGWYTFLRSKGANNDPERVITVEDGVIHVTGKEFGYFATVSNYAYYRLSFEVKWGETKWPPREKAVRDAGVLVHMFGADKVWPRSFECQIQEKDFGDIFNLEMSSVANGKRQNGRVVRAKDREKPHGEWNTVELIVNGDAVTNVVNGHVVNVATELTKGRDGKGGRLNFGKIALQSEGAEVFYRNIKITPLSDR